LHSEESLLPGGRGEKTVDKRSDCAPRPVGKRARWTGEEAVADVAYYPLYTALLIVARHGHRARLEAVVRRQSEQLGVEWIELPLT